MDFRLSDDQEALRRGMRELLAARFGPEALRAAVEGAEAAGGVAGEGTAGERAPGARTAGGGGPCRGVVDRRLWRELGGAGFFALRVPEAAGGVGLGLPEAVLVFEEAGRALLPGPLVATHLAATHRGGDGAEAVPGAAEGRAVVTALEPDGAPLVEHWADADAVLVPEGEGVGVAAPGVVRALPVRAVDPLTPLHWVSGGRPAAVAACGAGAGVLCREAALLTAAQQLGSAFRTLELAVGHARTREQFGRPVGAFQAVQHLCAGMLVRAETARAAVYAAAVTGDEAETCAAKLLADEAAGANARDCIQVHGGMGFTWEAEVHLHLKRAWLRGSQWRTAVAAEEQLAEALLSPRL